MKPRLSLVFDSILSPPRSSIRLTEVRILIAALAILFFLTACGGNNPSSATVTPGGPPTNDKGAVVVTSSVPTSKPATVGSVFPKGTLILTQHNVAIAQFPN